LTDTRALKAYKVDLICQQRFISSVYKESQLVFKGTSTKIDKAGLMHKKSLLKYEGVIFGTILQKVCEKAKKLT
jgi:hypothetical protein